MIDDGSGDLERLSCKMNATARMLAVASEGMFLRVVVVSNMSISFWGLISSSEVMNDLSIR